MDAPELYVKRMVVNEFLSWRRRRAAQAVSLTAESLDGLLPEAAALAAVGDVQEAINWLDAKGAVANDDTLSISADLTKATAVTTSRRRCGLSASSTVRGYAGSGALPGATKAHPTRARVS